MSMAKGQEGRPFSFYLFHTAFFIDQLYLPPSNVYEYVLKESIHSTLSRFFVLNTGSGIVDENGTVFCCYLFYVTWPSSIYK